MSQYTVVIRKKISTTMIRTRSIHSKQIDDIIKKYSFENFAARFSVNVNNIDDFIDADDHRYYKNLITFVTKYHYSENKRCQAFLNILTYIKIKNYLNTHNLPKESYPKYAAMQDKEDVKKYIKFWCN